MRLDRWLVTQGLARSRAQAVEMIALGAVTVDGIGEVQPSQTVADSATILVAPAGDDAVLQSHGFVSRAAVKLQAGLAAFGLDPAGKTALDLGASTGGFSQILLKAGVRKLYAIDIGSGQFAPELLGDPRVVLREKTNARTLTAADFPEPIEFIVADLSFISLTLGLRPSLELAPIGAELVALVKPQFEVGRQWVSKGGIVRDEAAIASACSRIQSLLNDCGWEVLGLISSPIRGSSGNSEFLIGGRRGLSAGAA
ncbi:MAG: TlyA family RNA methyltransferase [Alphaproteobacteria bacterium]|nr:TlyA family RNA methyltransferase [Alphaproteobacteria bacterium]